MLTDPTLRSQVDELWDRLWSGGLSNPLDAIEQFSYLVYFKRLDEAENQAEEQAKRGGQLFLPRMPREMRWTYWTKLPEGEAHEHVREKVFPWFREMGQKGGSFERNAKNAEFKINNPSLLVEACEMIDQMQISAQDQEVQGDLYEFLLSKLSAPGRSSQFPTPRHIIRMMVHLIDPRPGERIGDLAAGTGGFLVSAYQHILERHTSPEILEYDEQGIPHNLIGDLLTIDQRRFLQESALHGYDNDSGMAMLRFGSMNLMLHGIEHPRFHYMDTLSKAFTEAAEYDVILMTPPFKGTAHKGDVSPTLPSSTTESELLFLHLILRALDMGGRCAVIVPDSVLFSPSQAHQETRKKIVEENRLDGVVSMPGGVFRPYTGVPTAILLLTRGETTDRIWFYDMSHDGFSLDDSRQSVSENDIPHIYECWNNRSDPAVQSSRQAKLEDLQAPVAPLMAERLNLQAEINRLTFESAIAPDDDRVTTAALDRGNNGLDELDDLVASLQAQIDQLTRQFWVTREQVADNDYDLSASRYRQMGQYEVYLEKPQVTMDRLLELERVMAEQIAELSKVLSS